MMSILVSGSERVELLYVETTTSLLLAILCCRYMVGRVIKTRVPWYVYVLDCVKVTEIRSG